MSLNPFAADDDVVTASPQQVADKLAAEKLLADQGLEQERIKKAKSKALQDIADQEQAAVGDFDKAQTKIDAQGADDLKAADYLTGVATANRVGGPIGALNSAGNAANVRRVEIGSAVLNATNQNAAARRLQQRAAAVAQSNLADEQQKLFIASTTGKQDVLNAMENDAKDTTYNQDSAKVYNTQSDYDLAAQKFWNKYKNNPSTEIRTAAYQKYMAIRNQEYEMQGPG